MQIVRCGTCVIAGVFDTFYVLSSKSSSTFVNGVTMTSEGIFVFLNFVCNVLLYLKSPSSVFQFSFFIVLSMSADFVGTLFSVVPLFLQLREDKMVF